MSDYKLILGDTLAKLREMLSESVDLVLCSPPYIGVSMMWGASFHQSNANAINQWLHLVWDECLRVLRPGCKLIIQTANTKRRPYISNVYELYKWNSLDGKLNGDDHTKLLTLYLQRDELLKRVGDNGMLDDADYKKLEKLYQQIVPLLYKSEPLGEIIWEKLVGQGGTSWGSFRSPSDISLADAHEYIIVYRKFGKRARPDEFEKIDTFDFKSWRNSIWRIPPEKASKVGHVAPFPLEIPKRLITLYSFEGETVLDPFMGSGTTLVAALMLGRKGWGIEHNPEYVELARDRINDVMSKQGKEPRRFKGGVTMQPLFAT